MAREVLEKLVDDLDGGEATETVSFGLGGASYEIDLSKKNAAAFRSVLDRYVKAARRTSTGSARRRKTGTSTNGSKAKPKRGFDITQLREWAGANGVTVPSRGRIPQAVVDRYKQAAAASTLRHELSARVSWLEFDGVGALFLVARLGGGRVVLHRR